jgi:hypothetical protein
MKKLALCLFLVTALLSCSNESKWYPDAAVSVSNTYEYTDVTGTGLIVTLVIHNTGNTSILASTVTVKVITDRHEYLQSAASNIKIIPDGKIAVTVNVPYFEVSEHLAGNGVTVYNAFFD